MGPSTVAQHLSYTVGPSVLIVLSHDNLHTPASLLDKLTHALRSVCIISDFFRFSVNSLVGNNDLQCSVVYFEMLYRTYFCVSARVWTVQLYKLLFMKSVYSSLLARQFEI